MCYPHPTENKMLLSKSAAKRYNRNRGYKTDAIRLIQSLVHTEIDGNIGNKTVEAIYQWQGSDRRMTTLAQDGMFGPRSLGCAIAELQRAGMQHEASVLSPYPHEPVDGFVDPDASPIAYFTHRTISDMKLREETMADGITPRWSMKGCFEVKLGLRSDINDPKRYEYRQMIRGDGGITEGYFTDDHNLVWQQLSPEKSVADCFKMPNGLSPTFQEDVETIDKVNFKFGYRSALPVYQPYFALPPQGMIDRYLPNQKGHRYECRDTFGIRYDDAAVIGTKVRLRLDYLGYVYDKLLQKSLRQMTWSYQANGIVTW